MIIEVEVDMQENCKKNQKAPAVRWCGGGGGWGGRKSADAWQLGQSCSADLLAVRLSGQGKWSVVKWATRQTVHGSQRVKKVRLPGLQPPSAHPISSVFSRVGTSAIQRNYFTEALAWNMQASRILLSTCCVSGTPSWLFS